MYTHKIVWNEYNDWLGMFVRKEFRTTADAVELHLNSIRARTYDSNGDQNITGLRAVALDA